MAKKKTLRDQASELAGSLAPHVGNARDKAAPVLADARDRAIPVLADARAKAAPVLADVRTRTAPVIADVRTRTAPVLADARDKAGPVLADVRDMAAPVLADVRDKAAPVLADVRDRLTGEVLPVVTGAITALDAATEDARAETLKRGKAVAAALRGEVPEPTRTHRVRNLLLLVGLAGLAFALVRRLGGGQPTTSWQTSYTPPPAPASTDTGGAHRAESTQDTAASDPAEAAADATETPHEATTPDNPLTETQVDRP
jgi:ElaB/YqjD/DUF883 family membrane-anchored ribosome-binding protein